MFFFWGGGAGDFAMSTSSLEVQPPSCTMFARKGARETWPARTPECITLVMRLSTVLRSVVSRLYPRWVLGLDLKPGVQGREVQTPGNTSSMCICKSTKRLMSVPR